MPMWIKVMVGGSFTIITIIIVISYLQGLITLIKQKNVWGIIFTIGIILVPIAGISGIYYRIIPGVLHRWIMRSTVMMLMGEVLFFRKRDKKVAINLATMLVAMMIDIAVLHPLALYLTSIY